MRHIGCWLMIALSLIGFTSVRETAGGGKPDSLNEIAGNYYFGDGLGVNCSLNLSADGKFKFTWRGCLGTYDENDGSAAMKDGVLHLAPTKANVREGFKGTPTEFFPVPWGDRMY